MDVDVFELVNSLHGNAKLAISKTSPNKVKN